MSREWSLFEPEWPSFMQAQQPFITARPRAPLSPVAGQSSAAGRCAPADLYPLYYQDENMCYPTHFPYQQPSPNDSIAHSSPDSPFSLLYSPPHQQDPLSRLPHQVHPHQQYQMLMPPVGPMTRDVAAAAAASTPASKGDNPREIRNKAEKQRRDKLNQSISELANMVPPVVAASRKIDKTGVLRLTAHYLRAHQYVFGDSVGQSEPDISPDTALTFLQLLNGFLITTTYKGIVVVVSQNVQKYIGYTELELLGQNILTIVHEDDRKMLKEQLMPKSNLLGPNGELLLPDEPDGKQKVVNALDNEKRSFIVRLKKLSQRSEALQYVTCQVDGSLRKADRACRGYNRCCQMVRRARARGDNPCSSGNDVVFVGMVRPTSETFISEREIEAFRMEYRTRHSVDGQILQCEHRISLITGYMISEVNGLNAMNFMHRDDVRWVVVALREMYDQRRLSGSSCYRLMTKNGQFIYMKTQGQLEVDQGSKAVTTFVCTNTVIDEVEGKHLIRAMKKKFTMILNNNDNIPPEPEEQETNPNDDKLSVEDPKQLEQVIMHLVTNISSPTTDDGSRSSSPDDNSSSSLKLSIIPPGKDHIVNAIEKIYGVINIVDKRNITISTPSVLPNFTQINSNAIKIQELPDDEALQITAEESYKQTSLPKQKATSFEERFLNFDTNGECSTPSFIPKVSDQVLAAVQLDKKDPCAIICGQAAGHKRSIDADDLCHSFKRKTLENQIDKDEASAEMKLTNSMLFGSNELEILLEQNGIENQLENDELGLLQNMGSSSDASSSFPDLLCSEFTDLFDNITGESMHDGNSTDHQEASE